MKQIYQQAESRRKELPLFLTYGLLSFLSGLFLSTFDILVHANFLEVFGYKYLSTAYIMAGSIGIGITFLYSRLYRKIPTKDLNNEIVTLILICTGSYLLVSILSSSIINLYLGMVLLFPVNAIIILTFWRFGRKMLKPIQAKEISPKIKLAQLAGLALGGALTTLSLYFESSFYLITIISLISIVLYWLVQIILFRIHSQSELFSSGKEKFIPVSNNMFLFFTSPIAKYLYLFSLLSAIIAFSIHFTFINIAAAGFQNVIGLSKFYGLFIAVLIVFIFGVNKFLIRKILYSYDSPYSLVLIPLILLITIITSIVGYYFLSKIQTFKNFTVFFLLLAIAKIAIESLREIIQLPSMQALYETLDIRYRQVVYPRIEGTAVMLGLLLSGVVILPITFLPFFTLNLVIYLIAIVSIAWVFIGIKLIKLYKNEQSNSLDRLRYNKTAEIVSEVAYKERLWNTLTGNDVVKIEHLLNVLSDIKPMVYEEYLDQLLAHHNPEVKNIIIKRIVKERISSLIPELHKKAEEATEEEKELLLHVVNDLKSTTIDNKTIKQLRDILFTGNVHERIELAISLNNNESSEAEDILFELVKDIEPEVQMAALKSLARKTTPRFNYTLLDFLYPEKYNPYALSIIANSGDDAIDFLEREQLLSETPDIVLIRIFKIMGQIGNEKSIGNIISNITNQDRYVQLQSLQALIDSQFQANHKNRYKLLNLVVKQIGIITQNLSYYRFLRRKSRYKTLAEAYRQEIDFNYDLLFKFLSIVYNPNIIASLKNTLLDGTRSQVNHGIELADQYIDEDIKQLLFPLIEDLDIEERLKRLEHYFIQPKTKLNSIIRTSLTQDYKTLSYYPRACAIMYILNNKIDLYQEELIFNAYHKELLLRETAVFALSKIHPEALDNLLAEEQLDKNLEQLINKVEDLKEEDLLLNRFTDLKRHQVFNKISEHIALKLAQEARKETLNKGEKIHILEFKGQESLLLSDTPVFKGNNNCVISGFDNFIDIDLLFSYGITELIPEQETEIWLFPSSIVKELLYDHVNFTDIYLNIIENLRLITENE